MNHLAGPEVVLFLYGGFYGIMYSVSPLFILQKVCETYLMENGLDNKECSTGLNATMQAVVEAQNSKYQVIIQLVSAVPGICSAILISTWSDEHGRKMPVLFALASTVLISFVYMVSAANSALSIHWILLAQFLNGLCGHCVFMSLSFAMLTDIIKESRKLSIRIGLALGAFNFGLLCTSLICSVWSTTYARKFLVACFIQSFAFFYSMIVVKETYFSESVETYSIKETVFQVFSTDRWKDYASTLFKYREKSERTFLLVTLGVFFFLFMCDVGMSNLQFLFIKLPPLNFTDSKYAQMVALTTSAAGIGCILLPAMLDKLNFSDSGMVLFGLFMSVCRMVLFAISNHPFMIYIAAAMYGLSVVYFPAFRKYLSQIVDDHETARIFATLAMMEQISPLFSAVLFNYLYATLVYIYPGLVFLVSALIQFILLCIMTWVHVSHRKLERQPLIDNESSTPVYT